MANQLMTRLFSTLSALFFEDISPKFQVDLLKNFMDYFYILFEKTFRNFDYFVQLYFFMYDDLIDNEIKLAQINKNHKILVIGCGSLPATSILLVKKTGAKTVGIDKDKEAVKQARKFIDSYKLKNVLRFEYTEDLSIDLSFYDIIFIAYGIKHESTVFKILGKGMNADTKIIFRIPFNVEEKQVLKSINKHSSFSIDDKITTHSMGDTISLLLKNNN